MTAELRNLPHIASMAFNEPLMLEPAYARVFFCALAGQLGISRLTDAVSGDSLTAGEAPAALALSGDDDGPRQARSYQVMNGIAVLPVSGTLVSRTRALQPYSGMTGYNGIIARLQQAASDPMVDGILLDMDTPGGMVAGAFDCADIIARVRDIKPVCAAASTEDGNKAMKHTELRAAVLDALEKHDTGATFFDGRPAVFDEADFPAVAVYLTGAEYTGEELDSDTWQAELHIEVFLPAQVPDSELDSWMESRIYPVMSDIPALSDLITSMVASGYDYRRDDDAGLWSSADLTYVITYEM